MHRDPEKRPSATELRRHFDTVLDEARSQMHGHSRTSTHSVETTSPLQPFRNPDLVDGLGRRQTSLSDSKEMVFASPGRISTMEQDAAHVGAERINIVAQASDRLQEQVAKTELGGDGSLRHTLPYRAERSDLPNTPISLPRTAPELGAPESSIGRNLGLTNQRPRASESNKPPSISQDPVVSPSPGPPAKLLFEEALEWRMQRMGRPREDQNFLQQLSGRDHVCLQRSVSNKRTLIPKQNMR